MIDPEKELLTMYNILLLHFMEFDKNQETMLDPCVR